MNNLDLKLKIEQLEKTIKTNQETLIQLINFITTVNQKTKNIIKEETNIFFDKAFFKKLDKCDV